MNFKNKTAYKKWLGYGHATKVFEKTRGNKKITIRGKPHKVIHLK